MTSNTESQCYFIQLQFDTYLDCELSQVQREAFQAHLQQCTSCANEFAYAQRLHDHVLDLPQFDCDDKVLASIYTAGGDVESRGAASYGERVWQHIQGLLSPMPQFVRYAVPVLVLAIVLLPFMDRGMTTPEQAQVAQQPQGTPTTQYSAEELQQAVADLNLAIEYLNSIGQRTEVMIGDRFLITPLQDSLDASFEVLRRVNEDAPPNEPVY